MTIKSFTVQGFGTFPEDMLRYDVCEYASLNDEAIATGSHAFRKVEVQFKQVLGQKTITTDRWASFGWHVIAVTHW